MSVFGRTHIVIDYLPIDYSVINAGNRLAYGKRVLREKEKKISRRSIGCDVHCTVTCSLLCIKVRINEKMQVKLILLSIWTLVRSNSAMQFPIGLNMIAHQLHT